MCLQQNWKNKCWIFGKIFEKLGHSHCIGQILWINFSLSCMYCSNYFHSSFGLLLVHFHWIIVCQAVLMYVSCLFWWKNAVWAKIWLEYLFFNRQTESCACCLVTLTNVRIYSFIYFVIFVIFYFVYIPVSGQQ